MAWPRCTSLSTRRSIARAASGRWCGCQTRNLRCSLPASSSSNSRCQSTTQATASMRASCIRSSMGSPIQRAIRPAASSQIRTRRATTGSGARLRRRGIGNVAQMAIAGPQTASGSGLTSSLVPNGTRRGRSARWSISSVFAMLRRRVCCRSCIQVHEAQLQPTRRALAAGESNTSRFPVREDCAPAAAAAR
jgi:hypothetical protein